MKPKQHFKGLSSYQLKQDKNGNIKLKSYDDVLSARRARVDILLDNLKATGDAGFLELSKALSDKLMCNVGELSILKEEDIKIAMQERTLFSVLDDPENLTNVSNEDLLDIRILLSNLSVIERDIVLSTEQNSELSELKELFLEKKTSSEEYSVAEYRNFADYIDEVNSIISLEIQNRVTKFENHQTECIKTIDIIGGKK